MTNLILPLLVAGLVLVGTGIALAPIEEASAVHTTIQQNVLRQFTLTSGTMDCDAGATAESVSWLIPQPFEVTGISAIFTDDSDIALNITTSIRTDMIAEAALAEEDPALTNADNDVRTLMDRVSASPRIAGDEILSIDLLEEGGTCDVSSDVALTVVIETTGALTTAPTANLNNAIAAKTSNLAGD